MLILQNISYSHPNKEKLFSNINFTLNNNEKIALTGNNGSGKSTLLKIISGELIPAEGQLVINAAPYYVPQIFGQYDHLSIAQALKIETRLLALHEIFRGNATEKNFTLLNDDWTIEERSAEALKHWQLDGIDLKQKMETLSGGQKTKIFLAGISIHQPEFILLDEPSNHLDSEGRQLLYEFIQHSKSTMIVVSHDRKLLNLLDKVGELNPGGITVYGGNYEFYAEQKQAEKNALTQDIHNSEKALRKAREKERETIERQQKLDARGKGKQEKAGVARIMMNTLRNNAERTTSKIKNVHAEKISSLLQEVHEKRSSLPAIDKMKFGFDNSNLRKGKILFTATDINYKYDHEFLWKQNLNVQINSGERIALQGKNGSGKTTFIKIILGKIQPQTGTIFSADNKIVYIDQDYSLINNDLNVYEQAQQFNSFALQEHEIKIRLSRFLFTKKDWEKTCHFLSGGERMRLILCCLTLSNQSPDMIILDEPTNNLDIQNIEILTAAINEYSGMLIVVSHDEYFLKQINTNRTISLIES